MDTHKSVLKLAREQVRNHSLGKLVFLAVGPRAWGPAPDSIDYDCQGIYVSKQDNTYRVFVSGAGLNNYITLISFERILNDILHGNISSFVFINSPTIYASKDFLKFRRWINSNLAKQVYLTCPIKQIHARRRDYLDDFFFLGNGIAILEQKKVISNLSELNKKILKIPAMNRVIEEEKTRSSFKNEQTCKEIQKKLKMRLEKAEKKSHLPKTVDVNRFNKLNIVKKINPYFWYWPEGSRKNI